MSAAEETSAPAGRVLGEAMPDPALAKAEEEMRRPVEVTDLPVIDLRCFMDDKDSEAAAAECRKLADALHTFGCFSVRDPRVSEEDNNRFLDTVERYFEQPAELKMREVHPEVHYQIGATPAFTERPRDHCTRIKAYDETNRPLSLCPPELDPKWRYFWPIGARPEATAFADLNANKVVPEGFPEWAEVMDTWGNKMLAALEAAAVMAARGFGLPDATFLDKMNLAPHLLAPTASDFAKHGELGTVLAGYHYDLNFMTIHGKSRYPGLFIWLRDGRRVAVRVPDQCLLVQAGKQFEYLTGGFVLAGFHEVVVAPSTVEAIARATAAGRSLWRISSTLFGHIASDVPLSVIDEFLPSKRHALPVRFTAVGEHDSMADEEALAKYPTVRTGDQVAAELRAIALQRSGSDSAAETPAEP